MRVCIYIYEYPYDIHKLPFYVLIYTHMHENRIDVILLERLQKESAGMYICV
jgi:hypothetical protein